MKILPPEIVRFLEESGKNLSGKPLYRLVWSDDQYEWRKGTFNEFCGSIFLRSVTATKLVPKYPFVQGRWILERWFPPEMVACDELPAANNENSYEPIFVFQDKNFNPLPLCLRAIEILVGFARNSERSRTSQTACEDRTLEQLSETREYNELLDSIDTSALQSQLHMKEAIIKP